MEKGDTKKKENGRRKKNDEEGKSLTKREFKSTYFTEHVSSAHDPSVPARL